MHTRRTNAKWNVKCSEPSIIVSGKYELWQAKWGLKLFEKKWKLGTQESLSNSWIHAHKLHWKATKNVKTDYHSHSNLFGTIVFRTFVSSWAIHLLLYFTSSVINYERQNIVRLMHLLPVELDRQCHIFFPDWVMAKGLQMSSFVHRLLPSSMLSLLSSLSSLQFPP